MHNLDIEVDLYVDITALCSAIDLFITNSNGVQTYISLHVQLRWNFRIRQKNKTYLSICAEWKHAIYNGSFHDDKLQSPFTNTNYKHSQFNLIQLITLLYINIFDILWDVCQTIWSCSLKFDVEKSNETANVTILKYSKSSAFQQVVENNVYLHHKLGWKRIHNRAKEHPFSSPLLSYKNKKKTIPILSLSNHIVNKTS